MTAKDGILRHFAVALVLAMVFYAAFFAWIQYRRSDKGPWVVTFGTDSHGTPSLAVAQTTFHISQVVRFVSVSNQAPGQSRIVSFTQAVAQLPFGKILFQDPTFLPGTVTMEAFGHKIELVPRVLKIDRSEYGWGTNPVINLR